VALEQDQPKSGEISVGGPLPIQSASIRSLVAFPSGHLTSAVEVTTHNVAREWARDTRLSLWSRVSSLLGRHGAKFASFSAIGGGLFVAGLLFQAGLTGGLRVPSFVSYVVQSVLSVEVSYFLNRWFTWKGAQISLWPSLLRYNLQKVVTVTANLVLYGLLLRLGVEYLLDNVLLTVVFTFVNYIGADKLVFLRGTKQPIAAAMVPFQATARPPEPGTD
jgi:putative flippase GtrA